MNVSQLLVKKNNSNPRYSLGKIIKSNYPKYNDNHKNIKWTV